VYEHDVAYWAASFLDALKGSSPRQLQGVSS
jgi:hypothetical protein